MSVSHATPSLHFHRRTARKSRTKLERQHRVNIVLGVIALALLAVLIIGIVGLATTIAPSPSPTSAYAADGSAYVTPPRMAVLWLWMTLMDVVAIFAFGIAFASQHQQ